MIVLGIYREVNINISHIRKSRYSYWQSKVEQMSIFIVYYRVDVHIGCMTQNKCPYRLSPVEQIFKCWLSTVQQMTNMQQMATLSDYCTYCRVDVIFSQLLKLLVVVHLLQSRCPYCSPRRKQMTILIISRRVDGYFGQLLQSRY